MSQAQDRPLPDPESFYRLVQENLTKAERLTHRYAYQERSTDLHTNPFRRLGTGGTRLFEVYPSAVRQLTYRRLVERDGRRVSATELARQDREYRARAAELQERRVAEEADRSRLEKEDAEARQRAQRRIDDVVNTLEFTLNRRVVYDGTTAIVISFSPRAGERPTTRQGKVAQKFAGTIWVDEQAAEVMHVEATSIDDLSFGFGIIARLSRGTTGTITRRPIDRDVWMPTRLTLKGRGRAAAFLRRLTIDFVTEWFDYRRLSADSLTPFLDARVDSETNRRPQ